MRASTRFVLTAVLSGLLFPEVAGAQYDSAAIQAPLARNAASYDSPNASDRRRGFIEPSSSARPGVLFYKKAIEAFKKEQYKFAIEMYEVSASWAYKPAQYNLSIMYAKGQGVPVDMPRAMAWSALAAERGEHHYVEARKAINAELTAEQIDQAVVIVNALIPKYADEVALRKAKARWKDTKLEATGSKLGFVGGIKIGGAGTSSSGNRPAIKGEAGPTDTTAWQMFGGRQMDGSVAYRQLQETANPYDPEQRVTTGTATVGPINSAEVPVDKVDDPPAVKKDSKKHQPGG